MMKTNDALRAAMFGAALLGATGVAVAEETTPYKVFLSMSYVGNDWQAESSGIIEKAVELWYEIQAGHGYESRR